MKIKLLKDLPGANKGETFEIKTQLKGCDYVEIGGIKFRVGYLYTEGFAEEERVVPTSAFDGTLINNVGEGYYIECEKISFSSRIDKIDVNEYNKFITKEQAQEWNDRQMALYSIKKWVAENDNGFVPNWSDGEQLKYHILYDYKDKSLEIGQHNVGCSNPDFPYMSSESVAKRCKKECKVELDIYFRKK